jgi:hypothetical protein
MLRRCVSLLLLVCAFGAVQTAGAPALAATDATGWRVVSHASGPSNLPPGGVGFIELHVFDTGATPSSGLVTVTDELPSGMTFTGAQPVGPLGTSPAEPWTCSGTSVVTCTTDESIGGSAPLRIDLKVNVAAGLSGTYANRVTMSGGGAAAAASSTDPVTVSSSAPTFGVQDMEVWASNPDGSTDTQAGSHPYELTTAFDLNTAAAETAGEQGGYTAEGEEAQNITVKLPPGIIGDPNAAPQCPRYLFDREGSCPAATQIGVDTVILGDLGVVRFSVFNMVPPPGVPAQFAFNLVGLKTFLDASVRSGGDYGISEHVDHLVQRDILYNAATIWGNPADRSHDAERCASVEGFSVTCGLSSGVVAAVPFLTLPTSCGAPLKSSIELNAWQNPNLVSGLEREYLNDEGQPVGLEGCQHLGLHPSVSVEPDTTHADTPAGLTVDVKLPQEGLLSTEGLANADIKNTTLALPAGLVINPGQAAGLGACQEADARVHVEDASPACPASSQVGTTEIELPILKDKLVGHVYVLQSNPPDLRLLVAAEADGVVVKLVIAVHLDEQTGRLTATLVETPQAPVSDFKLTFSGGAQAALATPTTCGSYGASADFTPWSSPFSPDALAQASFEIDSGPGGAACPAGALPFSPTLTAGATTDQAGGYTSFSLLLQRADGQQRISTLSFQTPEGLLGMISKVPLCGEPQAAQGTCSAASQIGHTVVAAGPGPYPLVVPEPGQPAAPIYLTGGYKGAPFGLSIAVPVIAGPFNLGTVVVRASIAVDPHTSQLTITTDPLPSILDGIPTDLRIVNAVIDRPGFMFNPTSCRSQSFAGQATSVEGTVAAISSHFQMGSCRSLAFKPDFKVTTAGKTSRKEGASLDARILYPTGPLGANQASQQSNIASVKVDLPKQLPSRLTTLQKACTAAQFDSNPAGCPKASLVGHATAVTPVLPVPLSGPAYFVSRGGEAFPQLIVVLQGYGVTVDLVGDTFISKAGITSSTFKQVPDVPITSFDLSLPEGPYSALAANLPAKAKGSFCGQTLTMPTAFTGQDGAVIHQSTKVTPTGCSKHKAVKAKAKPKKSSKANAKRSAG